MKLEPTMGNPETAPSRPTSKRRRILFRALAVVVSLFAACSVLEVALRVRHGDLFTFASYVRDSRIQGEGLAQYDEGLGWVPRQSGGWASGTEFHLNEHGVRSNGDPSQVSGVPVLALGDSLTFGDEVNDHETWPAQLETALGRQVVNGGVSGYGVGQAVLRGEQLLESHPAGVVLLAAIGHDIVRTQYSYYYAWKPCFRIEGNGLVVENQPVPRGDPPIGTLSWLRRPLSYSRLANAVFRRVATDWWYETHALEIHKDGLEVTLRLLQRMRRVASEKRARFVFVALGVPLRLGGNELLRPLVERARATEIDVLDLATELERFLGPESEQGFFEEQGHYSPLGNAWVSNRIAEHLR